MAISPRSVSISPPASTQNVRQQNVSRAQAGATDSSPIEETSAQPNVAFDAAMLFQREERDSDQRDDTSKGQGLVELGVGNQAFATILEESDAASSRLAPDGFSRRGSADFLSRAIGIYEATSAVIHGAGPDPLGSTLNLSL